MRKLNKPHKYNESNVEFYSNEVQPVSNPASTNNSTYGGGNYSGGNYGAGGGMPTFTNSGNGTSFSEIFKKAQDNLKKK